MSTPLRDLHLANGATLALDGIPLHFGNLATEYDAAHSGAILLDRSHEGRLLLRGRDHIDLMQRMSTNQLEGMVDGEGRPTIFTNPTGRVIDRVTIYRQGAEQALVITEPNRGTTFQDYIQRHIFFNDQVTITNTTAETAQLSVHGLHADAAMEAFLPGISALAAMHGRNLVEDGLSYFVTRNKPVLGGHWVIVAAAADAPALYSRLLAAGRVHGLTPAGGLTYNTLCVEAGRPMLNRELTEDFIPLEIGLWDEVNFAKGCYTGQEIIARMESRNKLAKTLVRLTLNQAAPVPTPLLLEGKRVGSLTSCVTTPHGAILGLGTVKPHLAATQAVLTVDANGASAQIVGTAGVQPVQLSTDDTV